MGSLTERCKQDRFPVVSFFFSATGSIGRRTKTAFVATIAHQLAQGRKELKDAVAAAIEADTIIFKRKLGVQMETLVLAPLRAVAGQCSAQSRGVIVVDGVDECGVEHNTGPHARPTRTNEEDQLEILQVLHQAASDPIFPFRILIASRPERVFREFFDPGQHPTFFAQKLDLHEDYNADDDIALFLDAHFSRIRRRYGLPPSWPPPRAIQILVANASGQFIYAATVIRLLDTAHREPPKALLEAILQEGTRAASESQSSKNPMEQLDVLYSHILEASPNPPLSALWIHAIDVLRIWAASALDVNLLLQMDVESSEADHLLGNLHSLIWIPPTRDQATTKYKFHHKSLLDFLKNRSRCGEGSYFGQGEIAAFIWDRFIRACTRKFDFHASTSLDCVP
jgi:hypothetical protein